MATINNTRDLILANAAFRTKRKALLVEEKPAFILSYKGILATQIILDAEADKYGIVGLKLTYDNAVLALKTLVEAAVLPKPYDDLEYPTVINRDDLDDALDAVDLAEKNLKLALSASSDMNSYLNIPSLSVTADSDGTVSAGTLAAIQIQFIVRSGTIDLTTGSGTVYSIVSSTGCSLTVNTATGLYGVTSISADHATAKLRAVTDSLHGSLTIDRDLSLNKVKTGATGVSTAIVYAYKRVTAGGAAPTDNPGAVTVSLDGTSTSGTITSPAGDVLANGWTKTPPTGTGDLYVAVATASSSGTGDSIAANEWSTPQLLGANGIAGISVATVYLYRRSSSLSLPSAPQTSTVYTFSTDTLTGLSGDGVNWSRSVPPIANGQYLFITQASAISNTTSDTILSSEWSAVQVMSQNGAGTAVVYAYKRVSSGGAAPTDNPGAVTVSLDGTATSGTIITPAGDALSNGWTKTPPSGTGDLYATAATASSTGTSDSIASNEWTTPVLLGANGTAGMSVATVYLYRRAVTSTLPLAPQTATTYTFATDSLTGLSGDGLNWSRSVPSAAGGKYLFVTQATAVSTSGSDTILSSEWASVQIMAQDGDSGVGTAIVYAYKKVTAGAAAPTDNPGAVTVSLSGSDSGTITTTTLANGWSKTIPAGDGDLYATAATASGTLTTDTVAANEWSTPNKLGAQGVSGLNTVTVFLYRRSAVSTLPAVPASSTTYTFDTNTLSGLTGDGLNWSRTVPNISGGQYLFVTQATASSTTNTDTIATGEWSTVQILAQNGLDGNTGVGTALVYAYKRLATGSAAPTDNPGAVTVSLSGATSGTITTPATDALSNGWTKLIPTGSGDLYVTAATASSATTTDTIAANEWSTPVLLGANGTSGLSSATVYLYRRNDTGTYPSVPTTTTTYTFATDTLSGLAGDGMNWYRSVPNISGGKFLFVTQATAASTGTSDTILTSEWSAVQILAQNGATGADGNKNNMAYLYQWSTTQPGNPSGTSTFTWATGLGSSYTGGNSWQATIPSNPGTSLLQLWVASKAVADTSAAVTSTVDWTSGFSIKSYSQNGAQGAPGTQAAQAKVFLYAATIPSAPVGSSSYTWASQSFGAAPSGWYLNSASDPNKSVAGFTLWEAKVNVTDTAANSSTSFSWTGATINPIGYNGATGSQGAEGLSYVTAYCASSSTSTSTAPGSTTGISSVPATNSGGITGTWGKTVPALSSDQYLYQSDGIYNPTTNTVTWSIPYWSSLKVGNLSSITSNTGTLQVNGSITVNTGAISGSAMTGSGAYMDSTGKFAFGNSTVDWSVNSTGGSIVYNGTDIYINGNIKSSSVNGMVFRSPAGYTLLSSPNNIASFKRTASSLIPAVYVDDTAGSSGSNALYVTSNTTSSNGSAYVINTATAGWGMSVESSGSGSGAAKFRNSNTSKEVWCGPGTYSIFSPSGAGQAKFTDGIAPFTGIHETLLLKSLLPQVGDILVDEELVIARDVSNTLYKVALSDKACQKGVIGVFNNSDSISELSPSALWELEEYTVEDEKLGNRSATRLKPVDSVDIEALKTQYLVASVNSLGEGMINVCGENGNIMKGDLIVTSNIPGKGMKQNDDIIRSFTVAKARSNVIFDSPNSVKLVPCIYLCG